MRGELIPGFNLTLGYTYNTNEFAQDATNQGRVFNETTSEHIARLFATYQFLNELTIGGGVNYQSEWIVSRYSAVSAHQDDYLLVNLMAVIRLTTPSLLLCMPTTRRMKSITRIYPPPPIAMVSCAICELPCVRFFKK